MKEKQLNPETKAYVDQRIEQIEADKRDRDSKNQAWRDVSALDKLVKTTGWCRTCEADSSFVGTLITNQYGLDSSGKPYMTSEWGNQKARGIWVGRCSGCGSQVHRMGTHKSWDDYYRRSNNLRADRIRYAQDILQPSDEGYKMIYGDWIDQISGKRPIHDIKTEEDIYGH